jgi:excisionase family DNA binding protein
MPAMSGPVTTQQIAAVLTQLATAGTAGREIGLQANFIQPRTRLALAVLRGAPDFADAVKAGQLDLSNAYRALTARTNSAQNVAYYLTMAEVAVVMRVSRATVYRLVQDGTLEAIRPGPRSMRVCEQSLCDYLVGQAIAVIERLGGCRATESPPAALITCEPRWQEGCARLPASTRLALAEGAAAPGGALARTRALKGHQPTDDHANERVLCHPADDGRWCFWWPWRQPVGSVDDLDAVIRKIVTVLRTVEEEQ